jgi:predicted metal-binding membrane protein
MLAQGQASQEGASGQRLQRDRGTLLTGALLILITAIAWLVMIQQAGGLPGASTAHQSMAMSSMAGGMSDSTASASFGAVVAYLVVWGVMMAAMMVPSALPMVSLYGAMYRHRTHSGRRGVPTALFGLVYLVVWIAVGLPVYLVGAALSAVIGEGTLSAWLPYGVALVLLAAGLYQFSPLKTACLRICQSPLGFLMGHWRAGYGGSLRMGLAHAAYCLGCCWGLMLVLVVAGAMSLQWVLLIAVAVFAEKILPRGWWTARGIGILLAGLGLLVLVRPGVGALLHG